MDCRVCGQPAGSCSCPAYASPAPPAPPPYPPPTPPAGSDWYSSPGGPPYQVPVGYWTPPPPAPKTSLGKKIGITAGVAAAVLVALGIIGAVANHDKTGSNSSLSRNPASAVSAPNSPATPAGYSTFRSTADRFAIDVPNTWKEVDITSPGAQAAMNELSQANPKLRSTLGQSALQLAESGMVLMAINPVLGSQGLASNVNIVAKPDLTYSDTDLPQIAAQVSNEYSKLGGKIANTAYVTLDGRKALRITGALPVNSPDGTRATADQVQYYVGANELIFVITLTGDDPALQEVASTFSTS